MQVQERLQRRRATILEVVESHVGGWLSILIAFEVIVGAIMIVVDPPSGSIHIRRIVSVPVLVGCLAFDGWFFISIYECLKRGDLPLGPRLADRIGRLPRAAAVFVALGSLFHMAGALFVAFGMQGLIAASSEVGGMPLGAEIVVALIGFGMTFSCNLYLAVFLRVVGGRSGLIAGFWRYRFAADVLVVVAVYGVSWLKGAGL